MTELERLLARELGHELRHVSYLINKSMSEFSISDEFYKALGDQANELYEMGNAWSKRGMS